MCADQTQVDYEQLDEIIQALQCEGESIAELEEQLRCQVEDLCGGQWQGQAAESFHKVMSGSALPGLHRLSEALLSASQAASKISQTYRDHEEEAAALFRGGEEAGGPRLRPAGMDVQGGNGPGVTFSGAAGDPGLIFYDNGDFSISGSPFDEAYLAKGNLLDDLNGLGRPNAAPKLDARFDFFEYDALSNKGSQISDLKIKYGVGGAVYSRSGDDGFDIFGGGGGLQVGAEDKGINAGVYGEAYIAKGDMDGVLGSANLGLVGGVGVKAVAGEAFAGIRHSSIGAQVGVNLASLDGKVGVNVAGVNINLIGEVGLKMEAGITIGAKTQVKAPFFSLGITFGKAEDN